MTAPAVVQRRFLKTFTDMEGRTCYAFTLPGTPRSKKTSNRAMRTGKHCPLCKLGTGHLRVLPSQAFTEYQAHVDQYVATKPELKLNLYEPVGMRALVYREKNLGDHCGFMQALGDILQHCGIIANDRQILHTDGSRLLKDAHNPRVEIILTCLGTQLALEDGA